MHEERGILVRRGGWGLCVEAAHYPGRSCRFPAVANQEWGPQSHKIKKHLYKKLALTPTHIIALHWLHSESEFWSEPERPNLVCWFRCFNFEVMVDSMTWDLESWDYPTRRHAKKNKSLEIYIFYEFWYHHILEIFMLHFLPRRAHFRFCDSQKYPIVSGWYRFAAWGNQSCGLSKCMIRKHTRHPV